MISLFEFFNDHESFVSSTPIPDGNEFINSDSAETNLPGEKNDNQQSELENKETHSHPDTLIRTKVATGRWDAPMSSFEKFTSTFWTPTSTGDLYQRYDENGNPTDKYVKFNDGTEYKYEPSNKELVRKMYDKSNTIPDYDPTDLTGVFGAGAAKVMSKSVGKVISTLPEFTHRGIVRNVAERVLTQPVTTFDSYLKYNHLH